MCIFVKKKKKIVVTKALKLGKRLLFLMDFHIVELTNHFIKKIKYQFNYRQIHSKVGIFTFFRS